MSQERAAAAAHVQARVAACMAEVAAAWEARIEEGFEGVLQEASGWSGWSGCLWVWGEVGLIDRLIGRMRACMGEVGLWVVVACYHSTHPNRTNTNTHV